MGKDEPENFEVTYSNGEKEYFMRGSPRGLVIGPKTPGRDDHLTVGINDDDFSQIHRKINGREDWRLTPEAVQAEIDSFITSHTEVIDPSSLNRLGTYVVSLRRVQVLFSTLNGLAAIPLNLFLPLFMTKKTIKTEKGTEFQATFEINRAKHLLVRVEPMLARFFRVFGPPIAHISASIIRQVGKGMLLQPKSNTLHGEGLAFVISDARVGLLWEDDGRMSYIPAVAILQMYERIERNQPFGKLSEMSDLQRGSVVISGRSWPSSRVA